MIYTAYQFDFAVLFTCMRLAFLTQIRVEELDRILMDREHH